MEFNTMTLRPTYKLQWGSAGSSNALDIAQALGFDPRVLAEARIIARAELGQQEEKQGKMEQVGTAVCMCAVGCCAVKGAPSVSWLKGVA
jgi:dsDNA-specific endonuclease/ATPase MutS2